MRVVAVPLLLAVVQVSIFCLVDLVQLDFLLGGHIKLPIYSFHQQMRVELSLLDFVMLMLLFFILIVLQNILVVRWQVSMGLFGVVLLKVSMVLFDHMLSDALSRRLLK